MSDAHFKVYPIGRIYKTEYKVYIEIDSQYKDGLLRLDTFPHIVVSYWFDRNDTPSQRSTMQVHPRKNTANPLSGVFATHAPVRPNLIAISICQLLSVDGTTLTIDTIDALHESPVLDIKPLIPTRRDPSDIKVPDWV